MLMLVPVVVERRSWQRMAQVVLVKLESPRSETSRWSLLALEVTVGWSWAGKGHGLGSSYRTMAVMQPRKKSLPHLESQ